jgi:hypothetical protein
VTEEVAPAGLGNLDQVLGSITGLDAGDLIRGTFVLASNVCLDIVGGLLDITTDIKSVSLSMC